jgi:interferon-stimulated exonuclease-like 2
MIIEPTQHFTVGGSLLILAIVLLIGSFLFLNERVNKKEITFTKSYRQARPVHNKRKNKRFKRKKKTDVQKKRNQIEVLQHDIPSVIVAMDCEMVGTGRRGMNSMLARCSLVTVSKNPDGTNQISCIYDKYVKPTRNVTDYRTQWSGITPELLNSDDSVPFEGRTFLIALYYCIHTYCLLNLSFLFL